VHFAVTLAGCSTLEETMSVFEQEKQRFFKPHARQEPRAEVKPEVPLYWFPRFQEWLSLDAAEYRIKRELVTA
jgi:hypothetical protein